MTLSLPKLIKLLVSRGFFAHSFFKIFDECAFIEIVSINTADTYMLYIPSKYNFTVPDKLPNVYDLKEIELNSSKDVVEEYGEKPDPLDVEKEYEEINLPYKGLKEGEKLDELLEQKYKKTIYLHELDHPENIDIKCIHRQLQRLRFCVQNLEYRLVIMYKCYLCFLHTPDSVDVFYIRRFPSKKGRHLLITIDLEMLYNNIESTDIELEQVTHGIEKILDKNQSYHVKNLNNLITNRENLTKSVDLILAKKGTLKGYLQHFTSLFVIIRENEKVHKQKMNELVKAKESLHGDIEYSHQKYKLEKERQKLEKVKHQLIKQITNLKMKNSNITLTIDKILFDNTILLDRIFKNLELLSQLT